MPRLIRVFVSHTWHLIFQVNDIIFTRQIKCCFICFIWSFQLFLPAFRACLIYCQDEFPYLTLNFMLGILSLYSHSFLNDFLSHLFAVRFVLILTTILKVKFYACPCTQCMNHSTDFCFKLITLALESCGLVYIL